MTRWKAAGTHLALSVLVIGSIALSAFFLWYPYNLYKVAGLDRILLVMLGIDLTAGPLLTLILYRQGKWGLKFDLTAIAIAQLAFLGYGLHTLSVSRPVFLVGTPEVFTLVFANEIDERDLMSASQEKWRRLSWTGPQLVGAQMPLDQASRNEVMEEFMAGGAGIERTPKRYVEFDQVAPALLRNSQLVQRPAGERPRSLREVPIISARGEGIMRIDSNTARPIQAVPTG